MTTLFEDSERRARQLVRDEDKLFSVAENGVILWRGHPVAQLKKGETSLTPDIEDLTTSNKLALPEESTPKASVPEESTSEGSDPKGTDSENNIPEGSAPETGAPETGAPEDKIFDHENVQDRLKQFVFSWIETHLGDIKKLETALSDPEFKDKFGNHSQDIAGKLLQYLGIVFLERADRRPPDSQPISQDERGHLRSLGIRIGRRHAWMSNALKPAPILARVVLSNIWTGRAPESLPETGRVSFTPLASQSPAFLRQCGYRVVGTKAFRIDMLERLIGDIFRAARTASNAANEAASGAEDGATNADTPAAAPRDPRAFTPFQAPDTATSVIGASNTEFADVMGWLGYELVSDGPASQDNTAPKAPQAIQIETSPAETSQAETPPTEAPLVSEEEAEGAKPSEDASPSEKVPEPKRLWTRKSRPQHPKRHTPLRQTEIPLKSKAETHKPRGDKKFNSGKKSHSDTQPNKKRTAPRDSQSWKSHARDNRVLADSPFAALASLKSKLDSKT